MKSQTSRASLEDLEQRLLMTTLSAGEFFVYQNSRGECVRVELNETGSSGLVPQIELFAYDDQYVDPTQGGATFPGLIDLPGLMNGNTGTADQVMWPDNLPILVPGTAPATPTWAVYNATPPATPTESPRGAMTEIYAIYVSAADAGTVLSISTLVAAQPGGAGWADDINTFSSANIPLLYYWDDKFTLSSPAGSGGVIVGAVADPYLGDNTVTPAIPPVMTRFRGVDEVDNSVSGVGRWGVYNDPSGIVNAGITVASGQTNRPIGGRDILGTNVQAIAAKGNAAYAVDSSIFIGRIVSDKSALGLGTVSSLAGDSKGNMYTVNNQLATTVYRGGVTLGADVQALAVDSTGVFFGVDNATHSLFSTVLGSGVVTTIGTLVDSVTNTWRYDNVFALDFDPVANTLVGIGTITATSTTAAPNPAGPYLLTIDIATGVATRSAQPITGPGVTAATTFSAMAYTPDGTTIYAVTNTGDLVTINPTVPAVTATLGVMRDSLGTPIANIGGIDFVSSATGPGAVGALYAVANDTLYRVSNTAVCTKITATNLMGMSALTYDSTRPGRIFATTQDSGGYQIASISLGATLRSVNDNTGAATDIAILNSAVKSTYVFKNVKALSFNGTDVMYAVVDAEDLETGVAPVGMVGRRLVTIDAGAGVVTDIAAIAGATGDLTAMAFGAATTYAVNAATNQLYTINTGTGAVAAVGALPVGGFRGIQFVKVGANPLLYGVTSSKIYEISTGTPGASQLLGDTGRTDLMGLAFDATPNVGKDAYLWSTSSDSARRVVRIALSSRLVTATGAGRVSELGLMFDPNNAALAYTNVTAMDFDQQGKFLWASANKTTIDPLGTPAGNGTYLLRIDVSQTPFVITEVTPLAANLTTLTFDVGGTMWAVRAGTNALVTVNMVTGAFTQQSVLSRAGITGIAFDRATGDLVGVNSTTLFTFDPATGVGTVRANVGLTGMTCLTATSIPLTMYTAVPENGSYYLYAIYTGNDGGSWQWEMGKVLVAGTLAGTLTNPGGNIDIVELGFLWGLITTPYNIDTVRLQMGGGGRPDPKPSQGMPSYIYPDINGDMGSWIDAGGSIRQITTMGGSMMSLVRAQNDNTVTALNSDIVNELETPTALLAGTAWDRAWMTGGLVDFGNDTQANAQFLTNTMSDYFVYGSLANEAATFNFTSYKTKGVASFVDWYAMPMMAGQTISIDGWFGHGRSGKYPFTDTALAAHLYDAAGNMVDSLGYETIGTGNNAKQKPLTFTAHAAGIYYIAVFEAPDPLIPGSTGEPYTLHITGGTTAALGAINGTGSVDGQLNWMQTGYDGDDYLYPTISTYNGGNIGAYAVNGSFNNYIHVFGNGPVGGNIVAFSVGFSSRDHVAADGDVGFVGAVGSLGAEVYAGYGDGTFDHDAYIQNIRVGGNLTPLTSLYASGSIGVIDVGGDMGGITLQVNYDGIGNPGKVDMITVAGDWGGPLPLGVPVLKHGPGGDFGFVNVKGDIWISRAGAFSKLVPSVYTDGRQVVLNDDGGGRLTVNPTISPVIDPATGLPKLDPNGNPMMFTPKVSFAYIGVEDDAYPGFGVGGVIANLTITGGATMSAEGVTQISQLDIPVDVDSNGMITISGLGQVDIYYVSAPNKVVSFVNSTSGNLISGTFTDVAAMVIGGSIGAAGGTVNEWLHGLKQAPVVVNLADEPKYGWFNGTINGLDVASIDSLKVNGSLGDLRSTGKIGTVVVNADGVTMPYEWDGVDGVVWSQTRIDSITVGDGLGDDGGADAARAGIFCTKSIGTVSIIGPNYTANGIEYGKILGAIVAEDNDTLSIPNPSGPPTLVPVDAITAVTGTQGAVLEAKVAGAGLDYWMPFAVGSVITGAPGIGTISFSGQGAEITQSDIYALYVRSVKTSVDSNGIDYTTISGEQAPANGYVIGEVIAGGPGMSYCVLDANGGSIGNVKGLGARADMISNTFISTDGMASLTGRHLLANDFHMPGTIAKFIAAGDAIDNQVLAGAMYTVSIGGNFTTNEFTLAGELTSVTVGGSFVDSNLILQGPTIAFLRSLVVNGDISGTILSAARIGQIVSKTGGISADVSTIGSGSNSDISLIQVATGYSGTLQVGGSLGKFISGVSLGVNPETTGGRTQRFEIWGGLGLLQIGSKTTAGNLYADFDIGGNIGTLNIFGTFYGNVMTNGNLDKLILTGGLGGMMDLNFDGTAETKRGSVYVMGAINSISIPVNRDIVADLNTGGTIKGITLKGGSIVGNLVSRYGNIGSINITNGSIQGSLTANAMDGITVTGGSVNGDIIVKNGSLKSLTIKNGSLGGNVTVENGRLDSLSVTGGSTIAGKTISASGGIGTVKVSGGSMTANLMSRRDIQNVTVTGGDLTGNIWAQTAVTKVSVSGKIANNAIRGGQISSITAGSIDTGIISSVHDIVSMSVKGNINASKILAGLDCGPDMVIGGGDDVLSRGNVVKLAISGIVNDSVVAAGVGPGADNDFFTTVGSNTLAGGTSSIVRMTVGGFTGVNGLLAEGTIDPKAVAKTTGADLVFQGTPTPTIVPGAGVFGPDAGNTTLVVGGLTLSLTGAGIAQYDDVTGSLVFEGTGSRGTLTITNTDPAAKTLTIAGGDEAGLAALRIIGNVIVGDMTIDGAIGTLVVPSVKAGSAWLLTSGVKTATVGSPQDLIVTAGSVTSWTMLANYGAGTFRAESIGKFSVSGNMAGTVQSDKTIGTVTVTGNLSGAIDSWDSVGAITVGGTLSGTVDIYVGDLSTLNVGNGLTGVVNVARQSVNSVTYGGGKVGSVTITGNFGGLATTSFRASKGVDSFKVIGGFSGLLSTDGGIKTLSATGVMSGRAWAGQTISSVSLGAMNGGLIASSSDVTKVAIAGDMTLSSVYSGFDPGDAGYDVAHGGEAANLVIDAFTALANRTAANADMVTGGSIGSVTIGGSMDRSSISGAVGPGVDGYIGTGDDRVAGVGTVGTVRVHRFILGSVNAGQSYGVYAANNMPTVYFLDKKPFMQNGNAAVGTLQSVAGSLKVDDVLMTANSIIIYFNHSVDSSTINSSNFLLEAADNIGMANATDLANRILITYDDTKFAVTLLLKNGIWANQNVGEYFQLTVTDSVSDNRGNVLDGEFNGSFPSGNNTPGGDFVYAGFLTEVADDFVGADAAGNISLPLDGGLTVFGSRFDTSSDVDVYRFHVDAPWNFFSMQLTCGSLTGQIALFHLDDQGTPADTTDDTYELVARYETMDVSYQTLFQAVELSDAGDYYIMVTQSPWSLSPASGSYQLALSLASTDRKLVTSLGGSLPDGEQIGYVSNTVGQHNNLLGANAPKQLVYLNFTGGMPTKYDINSQITAFKASDLDSRLTGKETELIEGSGGVSGIVDDIMSIYRNTPASYPGGSLNVQRVDLTNPVDLAAYNAATDGLWFTTVDPSAVGLSAETDFTTVFIGVGNDLNYTPGGGLLGIASTVDFMNMGKADNAIVFTNNYANYANVSGMTALLDAYAKALANCAAHELGHTLGLNHQPTNFVDFMLLPDDPDNNPATPDDSNQGVGLMAYATAAEDTTVLEQLGTAELAYGECSIGYIDTVDLTIKWLM